MGLAHGPPKSLRFRGRARPQHSPASEKFQKKELGVGEKIKKFGSILENLGPIRKSKQNNVTFDTKMYNLNIS